MRIKRDSPTELELYYVILETLYLLTNDYSCSYSSLESSFRIGSKLLSLFLLGNREGGTLMALISNLGS